MVWRIRISREQIGRLRDDPRFRDMLLLARAANAVRFAITSGTELGARNDASAFRQRMASYFFTSAALEEAFVLIERLGRSLRSATSWGRLADLRKSENTKSLRSRVLDRVRNQAVFHHDDVVIERGLFLLGDGDCILVEGDSLSIMHVHYDLPDRAAFAYALEGFSTTANTEDVRGLIRASVDLGSSFLQAADAVIGEIAEQLGLELSSNAGAA